MFNNGRFPKPPAYSRNQHSGSPRKRQYVKQSGGGNESEQRSRIISDLKATQESKPKQILHSGSKRPTPSSSKGPLKGIHEEPKKIRFYDTYSKYGQFTNFFPCLTDIDGFTWRTTEHYFQANKFIGTPYYDYIRSLKTAREALQFSREPRVKPWIRRDWHHIKDGVMRKALFHKFTQNEPLKKLLLDTGDRTLIEHTTNDSYWGNGGDDSGKNRMGDLLMRVREDIKRIEQEQPRKQHSSFRKSSSLRRSSSCESLHKPLSSCSKRVVPCSIKSPLDDSLHKSHHSRNSAEGKLPPIDPQNRLLH